MKMLAALLLLVTINAQAVEARYFRAWQGFKKADLAQRAFMEALPSFMQETVDLYHGAGILSNYLVIIPPANKPSFVPDEFALVALDSREAYQGVRATPAGQTYSARHWDVFNRENSASADPMVDFSTALPETLVNNNSYDVIGTPIDWSQGFTTVFIGVRKNNVDRAAFLKGLSSHLALVKNTFVPRGLNGYIVIANQDYEVAFMNWDSKQAMQNATSATINADGARLMNTLMFQPAAKFKAHEAVKYNKGYRGL